MLQYAICEILGKQYKITSNQPINVNLQQGQKDIEVKLLLMVENGKLKIGKPYLKEKLKLTNLGDVKGKKIRVSKYHAKANYRRTRGFRPKYTKVVLDVKKAK